MKTLLSLFCLVTYLTCALSANGWPMSLDMACNKALSAVACSFEFTNNANKDLYLLKRNTPLEGLNSQFVSVSLDGHPLEYEGIYIHRLPPTKDEFVLLKAGESISASVQITDVFRIDTDGLYTVQYSRTLQYLSVNEMSALSTGKLRQSSVRESVHIHLENTRLLSKPEEQKVEIDYTVYVQSCNTVSFSNGDRNNSATLDAHKLLCAGIDKANGGVGNNDLYVTWFGKYKYSRAASVKDLYSKIRTGLGKYALIYYNNGPLCHFKMIAYTVVSYNQGVVYLCDEYYDNPTACRGTDYTKEYTLLHEWAHALAGRIDEGFGPDDCKAFARANPDKAIRNADNFSYHYCESQ